MDSAISIDTIFASLLSSVCKGQNLTLHFVWRVWWALELVMFLLVSAEERSWSATDMPYWERSWRP